MRVARREVGSGCFDFAAVAAAVAAVAVVDRSRKHQPQAVGAVVSLLAASPAVIGLLVTAAVAAGTTES